MNVHIIILIESVIFTRFSLTIRNLYKGIQLPDYDYDRNLDKSKYGIRERFLKSKSEMKLLDKLSPNKEYLDGIVHYEMDENHHHWSKVSEITQKLRRMLAAVDVEYTYRRDHFWRTWRKVAYPDGIKVICYRCNRYVNETCKECNSAGYWSIEENPPCPYEVYSMVTKYQMCAATLTQPYDHKHPCPTLIKFPELTRSCDNPITTTYRISRILGSPKRHSNICGHQNYCEVSTYYMIYKEFIAFRLMDSNNNILYSKIMKPPSRNYYCVVDCGRFDFTANKIDDKPLSINLFSSHINKRDNVNNKLNYSASASNAGFEHETKQARKNRIKKIPPERNVTATVSPCTKLSRQITTEDYDESYAYQDFEHKFI